MAVKPIPDGYHTVTPYLIVKDARKALDWYGQTLGATELFRMDSPDGRIMHSEMRVGDSVVMLADEFPEMSSEWKGPASLGGTPVTLFLYSEDCDALFNKAVAAGAKGDQAPEDMFWGDRHGRFTDPFGHKWSVATHKEDVSPEEMKRRQEKWMAAQGGGQTSAQA